MHSEALPTVVADSNSFSCARGARACVLLSIDSSGLQYRKSRCYLGKCPDLFVYIQWSGDQGVGSLYIALYIAIFLPC